MNTRIASDIFAQAVKKAHHEDFLTSASVSLAFSGGSIAEVSLALAHKGVIGQIHKDFIDDNDLTDQAYRVFKKVLAEMKEKKESAVVVIILSVTRKQISKIRVRHEHTVT